MPILTKRPLGLTTRAAIILSGSVLLLAGIVFAQSLRPSMKFEAEATTLSGTVQVSNDSTASGGSAITFTSGDNYSRQLLKIKSQPWRNKNEDDSPYKNTPMSEIDRNISVLFGPKQAYVDGYFAEEELFLDPNNGNMRTGCEFSHFSYDDPIVYPGRPEAAHLHMFFGNTDINAYSTWDTVYNSGGGTCNGGELNRTGYWVPAMFDQNGNVRVPHFINLYYKHDNMRDHPERISYYPENAQIVSNTGEFGFICMNEWGGQGANSNFLDGQQCPGGELPGGAKQYLEHNVLFQNCWNNQDPSNKNNFVVSMYSYFGGPCPVDFPTRLPNIRYRIRYIIEPGDDTRLWYLSSDVDRTTGNKLRGGSTNHGDWWGAWNKEVNRLWVDRCNNVLGASCGYGFLDAKSLQEAPNGPALRYREKYANIPVKIPAQDIYSSICSHARTLQRPEQAAYCQP